MEMLITLLLVIVGIIIMLTGTYIQEKFIWNNGTCRKCLTKWRISSKFKNTRTLDTYVCNCRVEAFVFNKK